MDRVQDVAFAGAVQAGDGVELGVEVGDLGPVHVGFETLQDYFVYVHSNYLCLWNSGIKVIYIGTKNK